MVASSDRAARAILAAYHRARRGEGLSAWPAPDVLSWSTFLQSEWQKRSNDSRLLLNPLQEESIWAEIIQASGHSAALLSGPLHRMASLAIEAHSLLCDYAPRLLESSARRGWQQDAAAFSRWLEEFERRCHANQLISISHIARELTALLRADAESRQPLLLAGFDRSTFTQQNLFDAWGKYTHVVPSTPASILHHYAARDPQSELAACTRWCRHQLESNPHAHILVLTQEIQQRRGEFERAFLREALPFEFSLGVPLSSVGITRSAYLLLQWLDGSLLEHEIDWLFSTDPIGSTQETASLQAHHRALRRRGLERTQWTLDAFLRQLKTPSFLPASWIQRITASQLELHSVARQQKSPHHWAELIPQLLETAGWPGPRTHASIEFQAMQRWQHTVELCASLGFDGRQITWQQFLTELRNALESTLFSPESEDVPVFITSLAESAGLYADAIWVLGVDEDSWPAPGSLHPLLPPAIQREAKMPHAAPQIDHNLAQTITRRIIHSASVSYFSHARQRDGVEKRASSVIAQIVGEALQLPQNLTVTHSQTPLIMSFTDHSLIPLHYSTAEDETVLGGSTVLTTQSQCPFKAFATTRLNAQRWRAAEMGLTPYVRGQLLHAALHAIWGGPPNGIRTVQELQSISDLISFVASHTQRILAALLPASAREQMPPRYLELEEQRLTHLVTEWLNYEVARLPFTVQETEAETAVTIAGLTLHLRLDRIDKLNDGTLLVIDYKTGPVSPSEWEMPRPEDVQLPLYACFALPLESELGGLTFAKIRPSECAFSGSVGDPASTLFPNLRSTSPLVKNALTAEKLIAWREYIEQLVRAFLTGRADVDPRDPQETCQQCGLHTLCRIHEQTGSTETSDEE